MESEKFLKEFMKDKGIKWQGEIILGDKDECIFHVCELMDKYARILLNKAITDVENQVQDWKLTEKDRLDSGIAVIQLLIKKQLIYVYE